MRFQILTLFLFSAIPSGAGSAIDLPADPQGTARIFYTELRRLGVHSLPAGEEWNLLAPRVTEELAQAITLAQKEQAEFMKKHPDEKPPWVDGDLFSSLFEGPKTFVIGEAKTKGDRSEVPVKCVHTEGGETFKWTDTIILKETEKGWLVDDIHYGGSWDFAATGTLKEALAPEEE